MAPFSVREILTDVGGYGRVTFCGTYSPLPSVFQDLPPENVEQARAAFHAIWTRIAHGEKYAGNKGLKDAFSQLGAWFDHEVFGPNPPTLPSR